MVKYNNFWLGSITHKDLVVFVDEHLGRSEYLSHLITADVITHKETLTLCYETPYGDGAELTFDAYGFENRLDLINNTVEAWRKLVDEANNGRKFGGKTYAENLREVLEAKKLQQELTQDFNASI